MHDHDEIQEFIFALPEDNEEEWFTSDRNVARNVMSWYVDWLAAGKPKDFNTADAEFRFAHYTEQEVEQQRQYIRMQIAAYKRALEQDYPETPYNRARRDNTKALVKRLERDLEKLG